MSIKPCSNSFIQNEKILKIIHERLTVRTSEKEQHGEVFTPPELICEMLDTLPASVWEDKDLKWLDPANGIGNFPVIAYYKLMEGLKKAIPDEKKRSKHIIEDMLFMVELNPVNVKVSKKIFKMMNPKANPNIVKGSFLSDDKYDWNGKRKGIDKFDIIMGNPPYNKGGTGKGGGVYWKYFVFDGLEHLNKDGFLLYIHPPGWRKPIGKRASAGDVWNIFKQYCLYFVKMSDVKIPNFPKVDYYVLQKSEKKCKTHIVSEFNGMKSDVNLNISELPFIPHFLNEHVLSVIKKLFSKSGEKFEIVYNQTFKPTKVDETKSGVPHTYYYIPDAKEYKSVFKEYEKDKKPEYIDKPKIIMTYKAGKKKAHLYPVYLSKEMGSTRNTMYQEISRDDNIENILSLLSSDLIHFLLKITQYSEPPNYINEFKILNMIGKPNNGSLKTIDDIYKYYGITESEKAIITSIIKST
jgi:type I restriction-modification system DNA methylase subunit